MTFYNCVNIIEQVDKQEKWSKEKLKTSDIRNKGQGKLKKRKKANYLSICCKWDSLKIVSLSPLLKLKGISENFQRVGALLH